MTRSRAIHWEELRNFQGNRADLHQTVLLPVRLTDLGRAVQIGADCPFPNSMAGSMVPATGPRDLALAVRLGIGDAPGRVREIPPVGR
ncbi:MAG: hypothetical protein OXI81_20595 [Paracoccaceae bacterium]|nr:hypothetical protein [Paracoccaceae bacterium]